MHMTAIGGLCGFLLVWGMNYQGTCVMLLFIFAFVRYIGNFPFVSEKHTPLQVYLGFVRFVFVFGILYRSVDFVKPKYLAGR